MKTCKKCGETKDSDQFHIVKLNKDGRSGSCRKCQNVLTNKNARLRWAKDPQKFRDKTNKWHAANRFKVALIESKKAARARGHLACTAGEEEIAEAFTEECHMCGVSESECTQRLRMDHDHETGEFRGWLCHSCNCGLGLIGDDLAAAMRAVNYLR